MSNDVRQDGMLSLYLFNAYIDDLSAALTKCCTGSCIDEMNVNHLMYADDLVVFSPSSIGLSRGKYMKNVCHLAFMLNGEDIKDMNNVKYLGRIICSESKDNKDVMHQYT